MLKKVITYTDYNDVERTEDFYFNYSLSELTNMAYSTTGGLDQFLKKIVDGKDDVNIMKTFREIILGSYGEKSPDGKRFIKSPEIREAFEQSLAYDKLFMELFRDEKAASAFINGIMPPDLLREAEKAREAEKLTGDVVNAPALKSDVIAEIS